MTRPVTIPEAWTTRKLLAWMGDAFTKKGLDSPRLLAEMLVAHVVGCDRLKLYIEPDRPASPLERESLRDLVARALKHEPVQYLAGYAWFFGLKVKVDRRVLIPRPGTETIVEHVLQHERARGGSGSKGDGVLIADVCAGSGCIAIALLKNLPNARAVATEICQEAASLAHENAREHGVAERLDIVVGDLLEPLLEHPASRGTGSVDYLVSNPPYIPDNEWPAVEPNVKDHEPHKALRGGNDGLDFVRRLLSANAENGAPRFIKQGGLLLIEVADSRASAALELARAQPTLTDAAILKDHEGLPRVIVAGRKPAEN
jgi:release factor glutamine methyltransferase